MLFAAHPDDESLACGVILQRAVGAGAEIRVVYATDGENNPWPQRALERKWRLNQMDRERWGKLRRAEAIAALAVLGVDQSAAIFLGWPDQKLSEVLMFESRGALEQLAALVADWAPTHLLVPSISDTHPDHNALGVMTRLISGDYFSGGAKRSMWSYVVHGRSGAFFDHAETIEPSALETAAKLRAISCHQTQLKLSRKRFFEHAERPECFGREMIAADGAIASISRDRQCLWIKVERSAKLIQTQRARLFVVGSDESGGMRCVGTHVPCSASRIALVDLATNEPVAMAEYDGGIFSGTLSIPLDEFSPNGALFVKLERRGWFFDEAGWVEVPSAERTEAVAPEDSFLASKKSDELAAVHG